MADGVSITATSASHPGFLRVECGGEFSQASALEVCERAFSLAAEAGRDAVLVDIRRVTGREPTMAERFEQAMRAADAQLSREPRIRAALLGHEPMVHPERFGEMVARNRGADVRVFTDETQASEWLLTRRTGR
jgi:hypothetical protein